MYWSSVLAAACSAADRRDRGRDGADDRGTEDTQGGTESSEQSGTGGKAGLSLFRQRAAEMLRYGAGEEMVFLTRMKNVGGATARTLYNAGFRTPEAIMEATAGELEKLPRIGKKLAASIISQAESLSLEALPWDSRDPVRLPCGRWNCPLPEGTAEGTASPAGGSLISYRSMTEYTAVTAWTIRRTVASPRASTSSASGTTVRMRML